MLLLLERAKAKMREILIHVQVIIKQLESKNIAQRYLRPVMFCLQSHIQQVTQVQIVIVTANPTYILSQLILEGIIIRNTLQIIRKDILRTQFVIGQEIYFVCCGWSVLQPCMSTQRTVGSRVF